MRWTFLFVAFSAGTMLHGQTPVDEKPYRVGGSVSPPRIISRVEPEYTEEALKARRQGQVVIELVVTRDGAANDVHEIGQALEFGLDEKAVEAVRQWRFEPGRKGEQPVPVMINVTVRFQLPQ
jgi:protein TonB